MRFARCASIVPKDLARKRCGNRKNRYRSDRKLGQLVTKIVRTLSEQCNDHLHVAESRDRFP